MCEEPQSQNLPESAASADKGSPVPTRARADKLRQEEKKAADGAALGGGGWREGTGR